MHFNVLGYPKGYYSWILLAPNQQILARSEPYSTKEACLAAISAFKLSGQAPQETDVRYDSCFISYSTVDIHFAKYLQHRLDASNVTTWFAPKNLPYGAKLRTALDGAIADHNRVIIVLSRHSISSQWVEKEVESAFERERLSGQIVLLPVRIDDAVLSGATGWAADLQRTRNIGDFTCWQDESAFAIAFQRLLEVLRS